MARDCNNDIVCRFCKRPGHSERECEDRQEFRDRKRYGEYYSDILEGRQTDDSVFDGTKKKNTTTLPTTHKDNELSKPTPAAASTVEPVNQRTLPRDIFMGAFAYADDVALLAPTIMSLNKLIDVCVSFAREYHVLFNPIKR